MTGGTVRTLVLAPDNGVPGCRFSALRGPRKALGPQS
jgi:hypothetical protein